MSPQGESAEFQGGVMFNLLVDDVDALHARLVEGGLTPVMPLEDHDWGDRGFAVMDPCGVMVYAYEEIEPAEAFKGAFIRPEGA